ncbi:MAG: hypothetical protein DVB28_000766 [Verrucomicrobia bacterium]|nr:MAG: hypothetical protein DVB28_000766 [Verrucomicrobiota bacterium]
MDTEAAGKKPQRREQNEPAPSTLNSQKLAALLEMVAIARDSAVINRFIRTVGFLLSGRGQRPASKKWACRACK